jgi:hypothetical protein
MREGEREGEYRGRVRHTNYIKNNFTINPTCHVTPPGNEITHLTQFINIQVTIEDQHHKVTDK